MFTSAFAGLTVCCSCWFGCCKPCYPPPCYAPGYVMPAPCCGPGPYYGPVTQYGPGIVYPQPYPSYPQPYPGAVNIPPQPVAPIAPKKEMPTAPKTAPPSVNPPTPKVEPKPKPKVEPKPKTLYEQLGGESAIKAMVNDLVARAAADPKVNFTRKGTPHEWKPTPQNVERLKKQLVDFVGMVSGGPQKYTGQSMEAAHKGMRITRAEFDAFVADVKAVLEKHKVPAEAQQQFLRAVNSTAGDIVDPAAGKPVEKKEEKKEPRKENKSEPKNEKKTDKKDATREEKPENRKDK